MHVHGLLSKLAVGERPVSCRRVPAIYCVPSIAKYPVGVDPPLLEQPVFKAVLECGTLVPVSKLNSGETLARYGLFQRSNDVLRLSHNEDDMRDCADDVPGCTRQWLFWILNEAYSPGSVRKLASSSSLDKLLRIVDIPLGTERGERVPSPVLRAPN